MKQPKESTSRRSFLKKAGRAAIASTLVTAMDSTVSAVPPDGSQPGKPEPHTPDSQFEGKRKIPGWLPDTTVDDDKHLYLFLEEAIFRDPTKGYDAFSVPGADPFAEPASWILGSPFTKKAGDKFDELLDQIAVRVRNYNAALYWMRRLHIHEKPTLDAKLKINKPPARNPSGDKDDGADDDPKKWNKAYFQSKIPKAQSDWKTAVYELNKILNDGAPGFRYLYADMVRVNDYIVSMRVVAQDEPLVVERGGKKAKELGGSSSSHISISSAFSSS